MLIMNNISVRVIVTSCIKYSDLWAPLFYSYNRYWSDNTWPISLVTDSRPKNINLTRDIFVYTAGEKENWSNILLKYLNEIDEEIVFLLLEDFFLQDYVNHDLLRVIADLFLNDKYKYIRLVPRPKPEINSPLLISRINENEKYRVSTQSSLWRRETLLNILKEGETPWEFEINGTYRSKSITGFYGSQIDLFPYKHHCIQRGKWFPWSFHKFKSRGYPIIKSKRQIMTLDETFFWILKKILISTKRFGKNLIKFIFLK